MRICFVAPFSGNPDEGMKSVALHLANEMDKRHDVLKLDLAHLFSRDFWATARGFCPHIIHYVPGPSLASLIVAKALALYCQNAKVVISALHPSFSFLSKRIIPLLKPDLVLTQSYETEKMFSALGCRTVFLPNGVDTDKFAPVTPASKIKLRQKYGLDNGKYIILHVGAVKKKRNIQALLRLQSSDNQIVIIGSVSMNMETGLYRELTENGCLVWRRYIQNIEEIYALADCYIFPTIEKMACIELPLSVMEAMACNLPVISTRFGALPRIFNDGDGPIFIDNEEEFWQKLSEIRQRTVEIKAREKILPYSWDRVVEKLEGIYQGLFP